MVLVVACTVAQQSLGSYGAVKAYIRSPFVYWSPAGSSLSVPIFPGGGLVGLILLVNLVAAQIKRLEFSWRKAGLWLVHSGLILLFVGEFATGMFQKESRMVIEEGGTRTFVQSLRETELALIDATDANADEVYAVPEPILRRRRIIGDSRLPFTVKLDSFERRPARDEAEGGVDEAVVKVELSKEGRSVGSWTLSSFDAAPQPFTFEGRSYRVSLRSSRTYLPYSLTLKKFVHEVYPGTDIPKGFSSLVRLEDHARSQARDAVISMNSPLRYSGLSFYQAGFDKNDTVSILQVVSNPGRLLPYVACALVAAGLLLHFLLRFKPGAA